MLSLDIEINESVDYSTFSLTELVKERDKIKSEFVARMVECKLNIDPREKRMFVRKILKLDNLIERLSK